MQINLRLCVNDRGQYVAAERPDTDCGPTDAELLDYLPPGGAIAFHDVTVAGVPLPVSAPALVGALS